MYASVLNGLCIQACVRVAIVWNAVSLCEFSSAPSGPDECVHRCYVKGSWEDVRWTRKNLPNDSKNLTMIPAYVSQHVFGSEPSRGDMKRFKELGMESGPLRGTTLPLYFADFSLSFDYPLQIGSGRVNTPSGHVRLSMKGRRNEKRPTDY
uniref:Expressed conserved protein n=1 Tax=Echinococcus granulosus TaxID=6210 RepID=U6FTY3_ECHGR|nr:hypothetical protein EgrG_002065400 [Echinococcus granulosus]